MSAVRRRHLSLPLAIALMACVGAWQPSMTLAHAAAPHAAGTHHHGGGHVPPGSGSPGQTLPDACCDMCVAVCGGCPAVTSARALLTFATARAHEIPLPAARTLPRPASPHLHPLPLGPPLLRVA